MKADREYVKRKFAHFNELCFGGKLPEVNVRITRARTYLGQLRYKKRKKFPFGWEFYDYEMAISCLIDREESVVEDTIIHEMIHLYIASRGLKDSSAHGPVFRGIMEDINRRFDRNIKVTHHSSDEEKEADNSVRPHIICIINFRDGRQGLMIAMRSAIFRLWDMLESSPSVNAFRWYLTFDPYFNRYPRVKTFRYYLTDKIDFEKLPTDARQIIREGNIVRTLPDNPPR